MIAKFPNSVNPVRVRFYFVEEMGNVGEAASRRFRRNEHVRFPNRENSGNTLEND